MSEERSNLVPHTHRFLIGLTPVIPDLERNLLKRLLLPGILAARKIVREAHRHCATCCVGKRCLREEVDWRDDNVN